MEPAHTSKDVATGFGRLGLPPALRPEEFRAHPEDEPREPVHVPKFSYSYGEPKPGGVKHLTPEQYAALSPNQKAAVDYNTLLRQAQHHDANADETKLSTEERQRYDAAVRAMFGRDGGSDTYAPATLAVLRQLDYDGTDDDLDNFLNLKRMISAHELKNLHIRPDGGDVDLDPDVAKVLHVELPKPKPMQLQVEPDFTVHQVAPGETRRDEINRSLVESTNALGAAMAKAHTLLTNFAASATPEQNRDLKGFGAEPYDPLRMPFGFGSSEDRIASRASIDKYYRDLYSGIADRRNGRAEIEARLNDLGSIATPSEVQAFFRYADTRSAQARDYGLPLAGDGHGWRTPEEFRRILGLDQERE